MKRKAFFSPSPFSQPLPQLQAERSNLINYSPAVVGVDGFPRQIDGGVKAILQRGG